MAIKKKDSTVDEKMKSIKVSKGKKIELGKDNKILRR